MGMFTRISDIIQANINAILDKAEDPEKMIRLIIQEMEETLVELRSVAAKYLAEQKSLLRQQDRFTKQANDWYEKAQLALSKDKEDLARAALLERQSAQQKADAINEQLAQLQEQLGKLQEDTSRLNEKLAEAKSKQKMLVTRKNTASVRLQAKSVEHSQRVDNAMSRFDLYEQRIDELESRVDAYDVVPGQSGTASLHEQFRELESNDEIERELAALKEKAA